MNEIEGVDAQDGKTDVCQLMNVVVVVRVNRSKTTFFPG